MSELASELNQAAMKDFALRCSKTYRAGKFTRVGQDFMDEVNTDIECLLRELRNKGTNTLHPALGQGQSIQTRGDGSIVEASSVSCGTGTDDIFIVKGAFKDRLETIFNQLVCRIIQNKVQRQPTCGVTLGRTR